MLLPSKELAELSKSVDICLSGKTAPNGCDIRYRQLYWLMVFCPKGELMSACRLSPTLQAGKKLGMSVPETVVATVEKGLRADSSLEQLERRYIASKGSEAAYLALRAKVDALAGVGQMRLAAFLKTAATKSSDPALSFARGILVDAHACNHQVINHAAFAALRRSIESFVGQHPTHSSCRDLIEPLAGTALKYAFDLSAKCEAYAATWTETPTDSPESKACLARLAQQLLEYRDVAIASAEKKLAEMKPRAYGALRLRARLGQAVTTLTNLDKTRSIGVMKPIHKEWRAEATAAMQNH